MRFSGRPVKTPDSSERQTGWQRLPRRSTKKTVELLAMTDLDRHFHPYLVP
jgi:hypothetical protein